MPFYSAYYDLPLINVTWHLGAQPALTWEPPPATQGQIFVYRALGDPAVFDDAVIIGGPLPITQTSFTDTTATDNGISNIYWVVAYSNDMGIGGQGWSVLAVGQHGTISGGATGSIADSSDQSSFPDNHQSLDTVPFLGGVAEARLIASVDSYTPGSPTQSPPDPMGWDVGWHWSNPAPGNFQIVPSQSVAMPGNVDTGVIVSPYNVIGARDIPAFAGTTGPGMQFPTGGATDPPYPTPGSFSATMTGSTEFHMTYVTGGGGGGATWPGASQNTDVTPRPSSPFIQPIPLSFPGGQTIPVPTPLPCIPCCYSTCPCQEKSK